MKLTVNKALFALSTALFLSGTASASGWEVWAEKQGADRLTVVASFSGDGQVDEAQVDLNIEGGFEVIDARSMSKDALCVASAEKNILRIVPASGAGKALKSASSETCMFTVRVLAKKGWSPSDVVKVAQSVCGSSRSGEVACDATVKLLK